MTESYAGVDRRVNRTQCPLHEGMVEWIKEERDNRKEGYKDMIERLDKLLERQAANYEEVVQIRGIVTDGLQSTVRSTAEQVGLLCDSIKILEDFDWFRKPITQLRDHSFMTLLKLCLFGSGIYTIIHFGNQFLYKVIK